MISLLNTPPHGVHSEKDDYMTDYLSEPDFHFPIILANRYDLNAQFILSGHYNYKHLLMSLIKHVNMNKILMVLS
jgi:hypothetical protein